MSSKNGSDYDVCCSTAVLVSVCTKLDREFKCLALYYVHNLRADHANLVILWRHFKEFRDWLYPASYDLNTAKAT